MSANSGDPADPAEVQGSLPLKTDVIDLQTHRILVDYPWWVLGGLLLGGAIAVFITGLLGYSPKGCPAGVDKVRFCLGYDPTHPDQFAWLNMLDQWFFRPWPMFLYICVLIAAIYWSVLRHKSLTRERNGALIVTAFSMAVAAAIYLRTPHPSPGSIPIPDLSWLIEDERSYVIINWMLVLALLGEALLRWFFIVRGWSPSPHITQDMGQSQTSPQKQAPRILETISGDTIRRGGVILAIAIFFRLNLQHAIWPIAPADLNHLNLFLGDLILGLLLLLIGGSLLYYLVFRAGMGARLREDSLSTNASQGQVVWSVFVTLLVVLFGLGWLIPLDRLGLSGVSRRIIQSVRGSLFLLGAILLNFFAVLAAGALAIAVQASLHDSNRLTWSLPGLGALFDTLPSHLIYLFIIAAMGFVAAFCAALSLGALFADRRVAVNTLRFLGRLGNLTIVTFWIPALLLLGANQLILALIGYDDPSYHDGTPARLLPFTLGPATAISFVWLLVAGATYPLRHPRKT
jgi:hypothetical protein